MKRLIFIIPLLLLSLLFVAQDLIESNRTNSLTPPKSQNDQTKTKNDENQLSSDYIIDVKFQPEQKLLEVKQKVVWRNLTNSPTNELHFHLYPNALSNNKTEFSKRFVLTEDSQTKIIFNLVKINNEVKELIYFQPEVENPFDSTVAKIELNKQLMPGDSVEISFSYDLKIPRSIARFGYASGRDFYFIAQWFPKLGVFENGKWVCSQYHSNTEFYSDFSNYVVSIAFPQEYLIGATGTIVNEKQNETKKIITFKANNVIDFAWTASTQFEKYHENYESIRGDKIAIEFLIQPENDEIIDRKFSAAFNAIEFLEKNIGEFPYSKLILVDAPRTSHIGGMEYPQIITYYTPLYTPVEAQRPESTVIHEIVHQYFYAALSSNEVYEAWLDEGVATYLEEKILDEYYNKPELMFRFIDYYPIFGIQFLQFYEIPIIYTLRSLKYEQYAYSLNRYYMNNDLGKIVDTSYQLPNKLSYGVNAYYKPNLMLHTLGGFIGSGEVYKILSNYFNENKFSTVTSNDFIDQLLSYDREDLSWFVEDFIENNKRFDYRLTSITNSGKKKYKIFVERLGDGIAPTEIALYTETDTLKLDWDGRERWKEFEVESLNEIYAGEIDPHRKNLFDVNFANNSYVIESKYWGSLSIAIRWFFWIQNTLLLFGSVG